jgi:hypothetical protein
MSARHAVTGLGFLLLLAGCGSTQSSTQSAATTTAPAGGAAAFVRVENQSWANFNIFVVWETSRQRLGRSTNNTTTVFTIPPFYVVSQGRDLQFLVDPIGADINAISHRIRVSPGDTVDIRIPPS